MMFLGLFAVVFCEVAFLDIKSPDNKKVITGLNSLHLESLDNKKNTFFRFEKKSGFGSRKKGELYREDENGVRKYLCLLPSTNTEVNLRDEKHDVFITKLNNNQYRVSNNQNDCLTIEDDKVTSKKCTRNGNQHFNITFYKNNPEEIENVVDKDVKEVRDPDVEVDQMRSEKKKLSSTMYEDDVDVYVNEDEDKTEKEGVVWVEKPKEQVTSDENMKYRVLKPERFKENRTTSVRIKPGVIEEKEVADVIEKIVSTTISTTITETVRKVEIVTEYLPVESTTTIKIPSEQILPPIHTAKSYQVESQLPPTVQIQTQSQSLLSELEPIYSTKLPEPASIHIKPEVESTKSFQPPEPEIYSSKLPEMEPSKRPELKPIYSSQVSKTVSINKMPELEPIYDVKPSKLENQYSYLESDSENSSDYNFEQPKIKRSAVKIRRKRSTLKEKPDIDLELSCSSEERGSDSSGIDSSEQRRFGEKLEKLSNEMKRIKSKMLHPSKSNGNHSTGVTTHSVGIKTHHHEGDSISHQKSMAQSEETKVQDDKDTKVGIDHKDKTFDHKNIHLTSQQNMPQEEVDLNMTGLMFEDVLSTALGDDSDIFTGSGLSGLKDELAGTGIGEMIKNKTKNNEQDVQTKVHSTTPNNQHSPKTPVPQQHHVAKPPAQHQPVHHHTVQSHQFHHPQPQPIQQQQPPPQQQAIVLPVFQVQRITPHHIIHQPAQNNNQPMSMPNPVPQNNIMNEQVVIPQPNTFNEEIQAQSGFTGHAKNSKNNKPPENLDDLDKMFLSGEKIEDHPLRRQKVKSNENS